MKEEHIQETDGIEFQKTKYRKKKETRKFFISTSNKFKLLEVDSVNEFDHQIFNNFAANKKILVNSLDKSKSRNNCKRSEGSCKDKGKLNFEQYEDHNTFEALKGNTIEDVTEILNILRAPKKSLKKCRRCNYKKRTCVLDPWACISYERKCNRCHKYGHSPKSLNCKINRKETELKLRKTRVENSSDSLKKKNFEKKSRINKHVPTSSKTKVEPINLSAELLVLIQNRIDELEQGEKELHNSDGKLIDSHEMKQSEQTEEVIQLSRVNDCTEMNYADEGDGCTQTLLNKGRQIFETKIDGFGREKQDQNNCVYQGNPVNTIESDSLCESNAENRVLNSSNKTVILENKNKIFEVIKLKGGGTKQIDGLQDDKGTIESNMNVGITQSSLDEDHPEIFPQVDGSHDQEKLDRKIFAVNCEIKEIVHLVNFFRSFNFLWIQKTSHNLCDLDDACFFCNLRSAYLRLRQIRKREPKGLKVNEITCQLDQYESNLQWNWRENRNDLPRFIQCTLELLEKSDASTACHFEIANQQCKQCAQNEGSRIFNVDLDQTSSIFEIKDLIKQAVMQKDLCKACNNLERLEEKCLILKLSHPVSVNVLDQEITNGMKAKYKSHIEIEQNVKTFFRFDNQMYTQGADDSIYESSFGAHDNVLMVGVFISKEKQSLIMENYQVFTYGKQAQLKLRKLRLKLISPLKYEENLLV